VGHLARSQKAYMKPTYFGASVRILYDGQGPDHDLIVQRYSDVSEGWHDVRTFDHTYDFAWSEARLYAADLAANMRREVAA
jgi:hypothetical protein